MFESISTNEITLLHNLDKGININKHGKFNYYKFFDLNTISLWKFLYELDRNKVYILIPFISVNDNPDEPYTILSRQILITSNSSSLLLSKYIHNKINDTFDLYNIQDLEKFSVILKYKEIEI
jgi:hypothetical protein